MHSSKDKIKALILYICGKIPAQLSGVVKINKIIWFSEIETMYRTGEPLTGHMYIRQCRGPVALNMHIMREELVIDGSLQALESEILPSGAVRQPYISRKTVDLKEFFTKEQIDIINEQIEKYYKSGAMDISEISHDSIWASLEDADEMPLELYRIKPVYTEEQKETLIDFSRKCWEREYGGTTACC